MNAELTNILISKKISPTAMRILVLDFLLKQKTAVSLAMLEESFDRCDKITLYRTLKTFEKKGLIHSIKSGVSNNYALCENNCNEEIHSDAHLHFYCTCCKKIFCFSTIEVPKVEIPSGYLINELSLVAKGVCNVC